MSTLLCSRLVLFLNREVKFASILINPSAFRVYIKCQLPLLSHVTSMALASVEELGSPVLYL
jgi:hypothetical protein